MICTSRVGLFCRAGNELNRETAGTSIDLALVQQLIMTMQGKVAVVNRQRGTACRGLLRAQTNE